MIARLAAARASARNFTRAARLLAVAIALFAGGAAWAQPSPMLPFRVGFDKFSLAEGGGPAGIERTAAPGDLVMTTRVAYAAAARIVEPISISLVGTPVTVPAGTSMLQASVQGGAVNSLPREARIFCARPYRLPDSRDQARLRDTVQPCFVDLDRDGRFDRAFLVGARLPEDRRMTAMAAPYQVETDLPLRDCEARIIFTEGGTLQGPILVLQIFMQGRQLLLEAILADVDGRHGRSFSVARTVRRSTYPHVVEFATARIAITGFEPESRRLHFRIERPFLSTPIVFDPADLVLRF